MAGIKTVFGGAMIGPGEGRPFRTEEDVKAVLDILESEGVKVIDTAQIYEGSEEMLGKVKAASRFTIDTKDVGGMTAPDQQSRDKIIARAKESAKKLGADKVDIFYLHAPAKGVPLSETLAGINEVYKTGFFARFGLSNYYAEDVQAVYDHCKANNYVLPTVYQGNYNAVAQTQESVLFPTLRKLGIAFYAYSPLAGGFLTKTKQQILDGAGRFSESHRLGKMYIGLYKKPAYLEALAEWETIAKDAGCSRADLAYRWVKYNSPLKTEHGDAIIIGANGIDQLKQALEGLKAGPLDSKTCERIDHVWETIKHEAPLDNING